MLNKIASFIIKMLIVMLVIIGFYQFAAILSGELNIFLGILVLSLLVFSTKFLNKIDIYLNRIKPACKHNLTVVKKHIPLRSA